METTKQLAVIALSTLNTDALLGRNHVPRFNAGIGRNGTQAQWDHRHSLEDAGMVVKLTYGYKDAMTRVWAFAVAQDLTVDELNLVARLKRAAKKHAANLKPKSVQGHYTRESFGKHLVKLGVTERAARHFVYGAVKQGATLTDALTALLEVKQTGGTRLQVPCLTVWVDTHGHGPQDVATAAKLCAL